MVVFLSIIDPREKGPSNSGLVARRGSLKTVSRQQLLLPHLICRADANGLIGKKWPENKKLLMAADGFGFTETIGPDCHVFMFMANEWPELPPCQSLAVTQMKKWVDVIVSEHIPFPRMGIERKHDKKHFVVKK